MRIGVLKAMAAAFALLVPAMGRADTSFAYQGVLMDEKGQPLTVRNHVIVFRIYDQAAGGEPLWTCTNNVLLSADGQFSVELSGHALSGESLGTMLAAKANVPLYIGLTVDGDTGEISPRQKLMSVPKAVCAADSVAAYGNFTVVNVCTGNTASVKGVAKVQSIETGEMSCGPLATGSMVVTNLTGNHRANLTVSGTVSGKGVIPVGGILIWSGTKESIPKGWALCNGKNGTPDLSDRFVVGAGKSYKVKDTGGEKTHKLTIKEMPSHKHEYTFKGADYALAFAKNNYVYCQKGQYDLSNTKETQNAGGDLAHENRPPYYALCYIMRVQ